MNELIITQEWSGAGLVDYPSESPAADALRSNVTVHCVQLTEPPLDISHTFEGLFPDPWVLEFDGKAVCTLVHKTAYSKADTDTNCPAGVGVNFLESNVVNCDYNTVFFNESVPSLNTWGVGLLIGFFMLAAWSVFGNRVKL